MTPRPATPVISTSIKRFHAVSAFLLAAALSLPAAASAAPADYLEKASRALQSRDRRTADFWFARHLGTAMPAEPGEAELAYLRERRLDPRVFPTPNADAGYLDWLERASWKQWSPNDPGKVREEARSVEIASSAPGEYEASVVAFPEIQRWFATEGPQVLKPMILAAGRTDRRAVLFAARRIGGSPLYLRPVVLYQQLALLVHAWPPEFEDADGDGAPEVWVRYNLLWSDGPAQALSVFRMDSVRPELLHQFIAGTGGMVRRLPDGSVQMGVRESAGRFRLEIWRMADGAFQKLSAETVEKADWLSSAWRDYL